MLRTQPIFRRCYALFGCWLLAAGLLAQGPANPLSLAEALAWGVDNNLSIAGQRLGVEIAARNNNWVTAGRAPVVLATIGLNNSINSQDNPASFLNGSFYTGNATAGLQASYTLFNGYRVRFTRRQLGQQELLANQQVRQLVEQSIFDVAQAYYTAQLSAEQARTQRRQYDLSRDRLGFEQLRKEYGQGRSVELLQARSALLTDSIATERSMLEVENALRSLYLVLDAAPERFAGRQLADTLLYEPRAWQYEQAVRQVDSNATLRLLRTNEQLALTQTELARTAFKPSIDLTAGLTHTRTAFKLSGEDPRTGEDADLVFGSTGQGAVGVQAAYVLFDAGNRRRSVENAIVNERVTNLAVRNARQDAELQLRSLIETYQTQRRLLELQDALIRNAEANLRLANEQLQAGTINSFDYRELQLGYFAAVQQRTQAVYNLLITDLNLRRLTGELVR